MLKLSSSSDRMLPFLSSLYSWKITHLALKDNHSLIWLFIIVCAVLIINDYSKYVIDQYYPYVIATCSYFKILRLIATFWLSQYIFSCPSYHDSLIISTYEINTCCTWLQPWRGVFGKNLFNKLDKVCVIYRKKRLKTPEV